MNQEDRVTVTIVCFGCGKEQAIHLPRERRLSLDRYYWICFECQKPAATEEEKG